jgi:hypothetical protein
MLLQVFYRTVVYLLALMDYHCSKDATVAGRVFEHTLKTFSADPIYSAEIISIYLQFLFGCNNDTNARALFERALTTVPAEHLSGIWSRFLSYEQQFGELGVVEKLRKRKYALAHGDILDTESLKEKAELYAVPGIQHIMNNELGMKGIHHVANDE